MYMYIHIYICIQIYMYIYKEYTLGRHWSHESLFVSEVRKINVHMYLFIYVYIDICIYTYIKFIKIYI